MSNYPAKFLPFYLVVALIFLSIPGFCAQSELTEIQKQAIVYRQEGWRFQQEGNIEEAFSYYQKAMLLDPHYVMAYNDIGVIYEAMGNPEQAKQMYLKAIQIDSDYPNSYSNLALLYEEQKDYKNAILYWIKRATSGGSQDFWAEIARKHLANIARVYPEAYRGIGEQDKKNLQQLNIAQLSLSESKLRQPQESLSVTPENIPRLDVGKLPRREIELTQTKEAPSEVTLFREQTTSASQKLDNKTRALQHLAVAKESFARGQYVAALKEATVAEYFDSSNAEISAFIYTIRKKLLK